MGMPVVPDALFPLRVLFLGKLDWESWGILSDRSQGKPPASMDKCQGLI